jgi:hypothetical protein
MMLTPVLAFHLTMDKDRSSLKKVMFHFSRVGLG